ncbi:MAG: enoyl-CoA hydratase/isomerase family protein, partial [Candidatus Eremiobacteraeota bacterium]|nr:enoyl-CoA hydratase/isomerase family protein [Candidatus Eremiobacteraeota bacterium]
MTALTEPVWLVGSDDRDGVRVLTLNNPPINALSFALSADLYKAIDAAENDPAVRAVVFTGANGNFSGGADINDFLSQPSDRPTTIRDVIARIERGTKVYVAAIDGNALGGGLELSLACDYRVATKRSKVGLPEIRLGLLPGAGGTQRLTRLIGAQPALELMLKGESIDAARAKELGILDELVESDVVTAALAKTSRPRRRVSALKAELGIKGLSLFAVPFMVAQAHKMCPPEDKGGFAAHKLVDAVQAAIELDFPHGLAREFRLFDELVRSAPAQALIHLFFAERELAKIPDLSPAEPLPIAKAAVIGGGTMGTGIAITFANADIPVTVIEPVDEQVERAKQMIFGMFSHQVQRGRLTQEEAWKRGQSIVFEREFDAVRDADIVIEAVFENMDVKKEVFAKLDAAAKPGAILASNTSTLDIDVMAAQTKRPENVCGMHFFAPANIMKLLEIVRGKTASPQTLATAMKLSKTLRKVGVLSGNAFGFIGNRMVFDYAREALYLAGLGVAPARIDAVMKDFGMAMGPFAMFDLSGVDVFWRIQQERAGAFGPGTHVIDKLYEQKRWGQKTGAGFYKYEKGGREPIRDPEVEALFADGAKRAGVKPRDVSDEEIVKRLVFALANVGADLLRDGIALRPGDIDIVYIYGYGFPPHHGGPMWYADEIGVANVVADMKA